MADRPEYNKAGEVSVNVPESVIDSLDAVFDAFGLPEPGSILHRLGPNNVADALGVPTPDDLSDDILGDFDANLGVQHPPER
jgi:hypothetical protein